MPDCGCQITARNAAERQTLLVLLGINGAMFLAELGAGVVMDSTALIADSLDMLADMVVYAISFYAVGRSFYHKHRAAVLSGGFQITLASFVLLDVGQRLFRGSDPEPLWMMGVAALALGANSYCLYRIAQHRRGDVHMRASWIFTQNDVIANAGVILAGGLVLASGSNLPDLVMGVAIALLVLWGGWQILHTARRAAMGERVEAEGDRR